MRYGVKSPVRYGVKSPVRYGVKFPVRYGVKSPVRYGVKSPVRYGVKSSVKSHVKSRSNAKRLPIGSNEYIKIRELIELLYCAKILEQQDRNRNGGGVSMYIKKNIPYSNREDLAVENIELICIEVKKPKSKPLLIATLYRPPNSSIELFSDFEKFLQLVDDENKEIIITGDLDCNLLEQTRSQVTSRLLDVIDIFQLQQQYKHQPELHPQPRH